jgi:hypothetical protein
LGVFGGGSISSVAGELARRITARKRSRLHEEKLKLNHYGFFVTNIAFFVIVWRILSDWQDRCLGSINDMPAGTLLIWSGK